MAIGNPPRVCRRKMNLRATRQSQRYLKFDWLVARLWFSRRTLVPVWLAYSSIGIVRSSCSGINRYVHSAISCLGAAKMERPCMRWTELGMNGSIFRWCWASNSMSVSGVRNGREAFQFALKMPDFLIPRRAWCVEKKSFLFSCYHWCIFFILILCCCEFDHSGIQWIKELEVETATDNIREKAGVAGQIEKHKNREKRSRWHWEIWELQDVLSNFRRKSIHSEREERCWIKGESVLLFFFVL